MPDSRTINRLLTLSNRTADTYALPQEYDTNENIWEEIWHIWKKINNNKMQMNY